MVFICKKKAKIRNTGVPHEKHDSFQRASHFRHASRFQRASHFLHESLTLLLMLVLAVPAVVYADNQETMPENRTVKIGYIDYENFIREDGDGNYVGYGVEYLDEIASYTGWNYEFIYDSWENQLESLEEGKIDFICHAQKTEEREEKFLFSKYAIGAESSVLYARKDDERYYYNDFAYFDGMKIAVLKNSFQNREFAEYAQKKEFSYTFEEFDTQDKCFEALEAKNVDGVAMGSLSLKPEYKVICRFGSDPFYFMTGKENEDLLDELNDALGQITATGSTFQAELYQKYYGEIVASSDIIFTREENAFIKNAETIPVAFIPDRKPFSGVDENGVPEGITVDIVKLIEKKSGLTFSYEMMPDGFRSLEYLQEHEDTLIAGIMTDNPEFSGGDYLLGNQFYSDDVALACLNGMEYKLDAPEASYKLVVPQSYMALENYIQQNYPQFEIIGCSSMEECLQMLIDQKADFMAQNVNVIQPYLSDPHYEGITVLPTFFMAENTGIVSYSTAEHKMLMDILNKCIAAISEQELSQITVDHTIENGYRLSAEDMLYKYRYPFAAIAVLLLAVISLMMAFIILRKRSYRRLEEKNIQLAEAVAQADSANRAKSLFLARMSHEIRTPMNAIVGLTTLARYHKSEAHLVEEYLGKIEDSSKILLGIINDVLDMSAIESDRIKIANTAFNLREILTSISTVYYTQCRQKNVNFEMNTSEIIHEELIGDGLRLNQILLNLISNAYKFTNSGGRVTITVKEIPTEHKWVYFKFAVKDTGEGMSDEMQRRLFLPFEQEDADTAQKHGGSGLGLSIAKNLVELMGGSISCQSKKGEGTVFTVSLPFEVDGTVPQLDTNHRKFHALLVDDERDTRDYISVILDRIGVAYEFAADGKEALGKLLEAQQSGAGYDICFVDWKMPDMDGGQVTREIRKLYDDSTLVIIVSAYDTEEIKEEAREAGADLFLSKPLFQSTVFNLLMKLSGGAYVKQTAKEEYFDFGGRKALLAEDTQMNAEIAIDLLAIVNMQVDHAPDGKAAVEMFEASEPGTYTAILMDVQMPVMDGYTAAKRIRASSHLEASTIPIYAMTANAFTEDVSAALNAGMNGHIAKPIDTAVLYETLDKVVKDAEKK